MLLAVDIGNSFVKIALLREEKVVARLSLETERGKSADEYLARIAYSPLGRLIKEEGVEGAVLSSVVSSLTPNFLSVLERLSGRKPLLLGGFPRKTPVFHRRSRNGQQIHLRR